MLTQHVPAGSAEFECHPSGVIGLARKETDRIGLGKGGFEALETGNVHAFVPLSSHCFLRTH